MKVSITDLRLNRLHLAVGVFLGATCIGPVQAQDPEYDEDVHLIEEVVVTGSRIERTTNTISQEVVRFTAEDIVSSGDISMADALRTSTLNSFGSFADESLSHAQSNALLDLRGVGAQRNLVLLNGRRTAGSPMLGGGGAVNLNTVPYAAVDRIEIIADGASAVYGSDAIAGVTNIILKNDYEGLTFRARYGDHREDDGTEGSVSMMLGARGERISLTFSLEYDSRDPIYDAERDYLRPRWGDYNGDGIVMFGDETYGVAVTGYLLVNPAWYPGIPYDPDDQGTWRFTPGAGCTEGNGFAGVLGLESALGPGAGFSCGYAFGLVANFRAGLERLNSFVSAGYELTDSIDLYADVLVAQLESSGLWAPLPYSGPPIPGDPRNDIGATWGWIRYTELGAREFVVNDTLTDINLGARGELGEASRWELYYTYSDYDSVGIGTNFLSIAGLDYNLSNGVEDPDQFMANMKATIVNDARQTLQKVFAGVQFDTFELPGGAVSAYMGAEHFRTDYQALVDAQSEAGLVYGADGDSVWGDRDVTALFAEAVLPVFDWWEIDLALRYDDYSDFGSSSSPRIGTVVNFPGYDALRFKASWGEGFRAPDLSDLFGLSGTSEGYYVDYYGCQLNGIFPEDCGWFAFIEVTTGSNPDLDPELSESWSVGIDWQFAERWLASVNYFDLELSDSIEYTGGWDQLMADYYSGGNNPNVQRNENGYAEKISAGVQNSFAPLQYQSVDFAISGGFDTPVGQLGLQVHASRYLEFEQELTYGTGETLDMVGLRDAPEWRGNVLMTWNLNSAFASLNWDYIGSQTDDVIDQKISAWNTLNVQVGYDFGTIGTFTLGANNVLNKEPDLDEYGKPIHANTHLYDLTGRVIFLSYRVER